MTEPTDDELDAVIAGYRTRIYPQDMQPRFERAIMRAALAKWGTPPAVAEKPVAWEYRWKDTSLFSATSGQWTAWRRVEARSRLSTVEDAVREFQQYIADGRHYELRPLYTTPQPTQAQAGAVPLDEARRLFDAGWKAAALFCDREDVVADGIIGFGACPQFEAAFSAANGIKGGQHGAE